MMLFFEGNLLRLGNLFLLSGITLLLGPNKVRGFFMKAERMQDERDGRRDVVRVYRWIG